MSELQSKNEKWENKLDLLSLAMAQGKSRFNNMGFGTKYQT